MILPTINSKGKISFQIQICLSIATKKSRNPAQVLIPFICIHKCQEIMSDML